MEPTARAAGALLLRDRSRATRTGPGRRERARALADVDRGIPLAVVDPLGDAIAVDVHELRGTRLEMERGQPELGEPVLGLIDDQGQAELADRGELGLVTDADAEEALLGHDL